MMLPDDFSAFRKLSADLGSDPLQVQGPGGNTSLKEDGVMWIKASGTELADAMERDIFVAVDHAAAKAEAHGAGDGTCKATVIDPAVTLRPSIETTFHAALPWRVIAHTHSVATITHAISPEGRMALDEKLSGLNAVRVPYAKPGLPLTREILARVTDDTRVIVLQNHGLICCGNTVAEVTNLIKEVETRLSLNDTHPAATPPAQPAPGGFEWAAESWITRVPHLAEHAVAGTYYPDHVVFLGPALPQIGSSDAPLPEGRPAVLVQGRGIALKTEATPSQRAMLRCLSDVFARLPEGWTVEPIGMDAEAELLNWDAEKYRQALAARP